MKKRNPIIGIIGGAGPDAAIDFQKKLSVSMKSTIKCVNDSDHYRVLIDNNTQVNTYYSTNKQKRFLPTGYIESALLLKKMGADLISIPCSSAHAYYQEIQDAIFPLPLVNMIDETCAYISEYFSENSVGILAINETIEKKIYEKPLKMKEFKVFIPSSFFQEKIHKAIYKIKADNYFSDSKIVCNSIYPNIDNQYIPNSHSQTETPLEIVIKTITHLKKRGASCILLGCTDISLLLRNVKYPWEIPIIDPTLVLANSVIALTQEISEKIYGDTSIGIVASF